MSFSFKTVIPCLAIALALGTSAMAQMPFVPSEFYNSIRPNHGNTLPLCILPSSATKTQDREIGTLIAEALLLEPNIIEIALDTNRVDEEGIWPSLYVELAETCVGIMGIQSIPGHMIADWMTLSRPYLEAPYVLLVNDPAIGSIEDLPADTLLGSPLMTPIDTQLMQQINAGRLPNIKRLPYDRVELMQSLMEADRFDAAIVWAPYLDSEALGTGDFYTDVASVAPLQDATRALAILLRSQDQLLRTMIDEAIAVLEQEGLLLNTSQP